MGTNLFPDFVVHGEIIVCLMGCCMNLCNICLLRDHLPKVGEKRGVQDEKTRFRPMFYPTVVSDHVDFRLVFFGFVTSVSSLSAGKPGQIPAEGGGNGSLDLIFLAFWQCLRICSPGSGTVFQRSSSTFWLRLVGVPRGRQASQSRCGRVLVALVCHCVLSRTHGLHIQAE